MSGPLSKMRVLELTHAWAGPYCGMMLADMGADVIKVENPGQHPESRGGPPYAKGESMIFVLTHRNKRSLTLNLKDPRGRDILLRLAQDADVLVQNFRPGALEKMGLGYEALRHVNPHLVYCSVSGFGQTGPYAGQGATDNIAQGYSGILSVTGRRDGPPVSPGAPLSDMGTAMYATYGILSAYYHRLRTGEGQHVDACLLETSVSWMVSPVASYYAHGEIARPVGLSTRGNSPAGAYQTADGTYVAVFASYPLLWERFYKALGLDHLAANPRFASREQRTAHRDELDEEMRKLFRTKSSAEWLDLMNRAGVPCGPVNTIDKVFADAHIAAHEMLVEQQHATIGPVRVLGVPVKLSRTPGAVRSPAPLLGQHTAEILGSLGYGADAIEALKEEGVV